MLYDEKFLEDLSKLRYGHNTADVESYNSIFIGYAPKRYYYGKTGYRARKRLADLHYNEAVLESNRLIRTKQVYSRSARQMVTKKIKKPPSILWKRKLFEDVLTDLVPTKAVQEMEESLSEEE